MTEEIKALVIQSLNAHYKWMLPRVKEKDKAAFIGMMRVINNNYLGSFSTNKLLRGEQILFDIYKEIFDNIEKRFITGDSRDFIFEKL